MIYFLIGAYIFFSITLAAFLIGMNKIDSDRSNFWLAVLFWPVILSIGLGFYLADKVKGNK